MADASTDNPYLEYLNNYFGGENGENPVCREERQYALFLYNKLLRIAESGLKDDDIDEKVLKACGLKEEDKIMSVYYEVSFLRDFFKKGNLELKDYLDFNKKLYDYVLSIFYSEEEHNLSELFNSIKQYSIKQYSNKQYSILPNYADYEEYLPSDTKSKNDIFNKLLKDIFPLPNRNYGSITKKDANNIKNIPSFVIKLMQTMMNSKPDIGIIYEKRGKKYLKFIECKYISREGSTNLLDINCDNNNKRDLTFPYILRQTHIQYYIAVFVCKELIGNNRIEADIPLLLKFTNKSKNNNEGNLGDYYFPFQVEEKEIPFSELVPECFKNNLFD